MARRRPKQDSTEWVPPHNLEAEISALGSMLLSETAVADVSTTLSPEDFYSPAHREIYTAIKEIARLRRAVDLLTLRNELQSRGTLEQIGGSDYLVQIADSVPSAANAKYYAQIVLDKSTLRNLGTAGSEILSIAFDAEGDVQDKISEAEGLVFAVGQKRLGRSYQRASDVATEVFTEIDKLLETGEPTLGIPSGFSDLDRMTTGFYGGELTIVAARPAMGKTSLVLNLAMNVAKRRVGNVLVFSLEMSSKQLVRRLLSIESQVAMGALKRTGLRQEDFSDLTDAYEKLYELPLYIDDTSNLSPIEMRGKCRRLMADGGLAMVVVDYLQLMRGDYRSENRVQEISDIARGLKSISKELDVPVLALSQLNRGVESRPNKRPMLSDLRESGSIEAEADLVMFIYREEYYRRREEDDERFSDPRSAEVAELILGKHRNGPTGTVLLGFQPAFTRFALLSDDAKDSYRKRMRASSEE